MFWEMKVFCFLRRVYDAVRALSEGGLELFRVSVDSAILF